jgi:hypothetical protein
VRKVVVDNRPDQFVRVFSRPLVQLDAQFDRSVGGEFLRPAYDEFFRVVVEVLFNERRRVHRLKRLLMSRSFSLIVCGCSWSGMVCSGNEKWLQNLALSGSTLKLYKLNPIATDHHAAVDLTS